MPVRVRARQVQYPHNGSKTPAYLAQPAEPGTYPGVVVIQEWWGLEPHIQDVTRRFAGEGFIALAPDLYHGKIAKEPSEAEKLMMALNMERAVREIISGVNYLKGLEGCNGKVGVVGFCMGGGLALLTALRSAGVSACVDFYGAIPDPLDQVKHLECPLLGIFAAQDHWVKVADVRRLRRRLKAFGKQAEVRIYRGVDHAFFNDTRPLYNARAAKDAWRRTLAFFRQHLG
ncbi:MAG: dienelactone hydrolase family protein [Chloroflexota bacterium]|nr:dienelactone hydrolase family protein [Chloroflexota bacterium]